MFLAGLPACRGSSDLASEYFWETPLHGMVVAEHRLAVEVGVEILEDDGNAVDAAVATALALAVVYPQAGNLGGGGFALFVPHFGEPVALDFREMAPSTISAAHYLDAEGNVVAERSRVGPLAVATPGSPAGLHALFVRHGSGRVSFRDLVEPAIELAAEGFRVDPWLARALREEGTRARLQRHPASRARFYPGGRPLAEGDLLVQPELAETLRRYARRGPDDFYRGVTARQIVETLNAAAGLEGLADSDPNTQGWISAVDLDRYEVAWREPLRGWFRGREIVTMPPPSSGGAVVLEVLSILDGLPLSPEADLAARGDEPALERAEVPGDDTLAWTDRLLHWWIEAQRVAFADRAAHMGDPDFYDVPLAELLAPVRIAGERVAIGRTARPDVQAWSPAGPATPPVPPPEGGETTHISVLDGEGNAVSLTTTLNLSFGSGILVEDAGFLLNNELDDFSLAPGTPNHFGLIGGEANAIEPRKRPLSSMTPVVVREGGQTVTLVLGSPGGPRIITSIIGVLLRTLVFGQTLEEAVLAPRLHQQWQPPHTDFEPGFPEPLLDRLRRRGHDARVRETRWGSVQAIHVERGGSPKGVSDPRRGGVAGRTDREVPYPVGTVDPPDPDGF